MYRRDFPHHPGMHNMDLGGDSHTRVSYRNNPNFCERIGRSLVAVLVGIAVIIVAVCLLWWNEGRAVTTARSLEEGLDRVVSLGTIHVAFDQNNGKLVHLTGPLKTGKVLSDSAYGVSVRAVKLKRHVEMYQWVEHEHRREVNEGDKTREEVTYSYSKEWKSEVIQSSSFDNPTRHHNPNSMAVKPNVFIAEDAQVGNFYLSENLKSKITNYKQLKPQHPPPDGSVKLVDGVFYHANDPFNPQIGDIKVTFEYAGVSSGDSARAPDMVSVVARQQGSQLTKYQTEAGDVLEILYLGELTAEEIFEKEHAQNNIFTWLLRLAGWFVMFVGFGLSTSIINTLVDWIPIVRELVGLGMCTLNMTMSMSLSITVIALGWIRYRPWFGFSILACAMIPVLLSKYRVSSLNSRDRRL
ncbi:transmembrane protein 43 isoform X1 [Lingula anatina]|uniref:Transmembrane protein 43 isoform X1 n=2 Tax=Lingula anatina TaxID=7574 RepID=A0A1S3IDU5_LINAN|nr:transmembrane protein 43 isoform X1 [Lingula anatina]|eukprot:XP_013396407.1 transmembrane protein 43 isoform X1 [Lingula anatina]